MAVNNDLPNVYIKGYSGIPVLYKAVGRILLTGADGESRVPYSYGEAVEGLEIPVDFSSGDQTIRAPTGKLVKEAIILMPANLLPENIKKGVTIAGVTGTYVGNGGIQWTYPVQTGSVLTIHSGLPTQAGGVLNFGGAK